MGDCYVGLMSGTSVDAADAVLVRFEGDVPQLLAAHAEPPDASLRSDLLQLSQQVAGVSLSKFGELNQRVADWFANAALAVMETADIDPADIAAIGSHGQTVRHEPDAVFPFSLQLGAPSLIAARTGCRVVADFRNSDIAIGGQGAPLVPAFHRSVFAHDRHNRVVINIGGIANLTVLPTAARADLSAVTGLDTGPGNALMDAWVASHLNHRYDDGGHWASSGRIDNNLLGQMLADPYFARSAPKSTGREYFNLDWLRAQIDSVGAPPIPVDVQATLCELSARTMVQAIEDYGPGDEELLLCGGGAHNHELVRRLEQLAAPRTLKLTDDYQIDADWVEATAFAWLAKRTLEGRSGNVPSVTGAREAVALGGVYLAGARPDALKQQ